MSKELAKTYDPKGIEERLYQKWMDNGYFHAKVNPDKKPFTIVMPPPNVTGQLHMGHALDETMQDILIRFKRMQGYEALWQPGTDHAAIATEVKVTEKLKKEGIDKAEIGREKFLEYAWEWKEEYGSRILLLPFIPSDWTLHAFGMSGLLTSLLMQRYADREHPGKFIGMLCILGVGMLILALVSHPYWIISKIQATPSWLFYCLAAFFPLFGFFYWLTDVKGNTNRFDIIKPAGTATLTCYILPYIWYSVQQLAGWTYPEVLGSGVPGLLKSLVFSIVIVQLTGLLVKGKIKLKV